MAEQPPLSRNELEEIRKHHAGEPPVERLAGEVDRLRRELTDAKANLETLLMAWRHHEPTDAYGAITAVVRRLGAVLAATDAADEEVRSVMRALQDEFERGE